MATSVCDCIQNNSCFQEWFRARYPNGCCGCCEGTGCGGNCFYAWQTNIWKLDSENCSGATIDAGQGKLICRCATYLNPEDWPHVPGQDTLTIPCDYSYVIARSLYCKGKGLLGINPEVFKQGSKSLTKAGCGTCGQQVRQQATTNEVRKEALATTPRRKLF